MDETKIELFLKELFEMVDSRPMLAEKIAKRIPKKHLLLNPLRAYFKGDNERVCDLSAWLALHHFAHNLSFEDIVWFKRSGNVLIQEMSEWTALAYPHEKITLQGLLDTQRIANRMCRSLGKKVAMKISKKFFNFQTLLCYKNDKDKDVRDLVELLILSNFSERVSIEKIFIHIESKDMLKKELATRAAIFHHYNELRYDQILRCMTSEDVDTRTRLMVLANDVNTDEYKHIDLAKFLNSSNENIKELALNMLIKIPFSRYYLQEEQAELFAIISEQESVYLTSYAKETLYSIPKQHLAVSVLEAQADKEDSEISGIAKELLFQLGSEKSESELVQEFLDKYAISSYGE